MKIVLLESLSIPSEDLNEYVKLLKEQGHSVEQYERNLDEDIQIERVKDADIIIIANMPLTGNVISKCKNLKYINVAFTGVDDVDLNAAKQMGVSVSNASGYATEAVAEFVLGTIISRLRNIVAVDKRCREGKTKDGLVGRELNGKTIGIIGTGAIGMRTAELCHTFHCDILAYDVIPKKDAPKYIKYVSLEELLVSSDIITVHCPLTDGTYHLINKERIGMMKPRAILINAARGLVVDSQALANALNLGKIEGAVIDVFETEPPLDISHPLLHARNTIVTPHIAFASDESMKKRAKIVFDNIESWIKGEQKNIII